MATGKASPQYGTRYYNDVALRLGHKLYGLEYLHFGYFKDIPVTVVDLPRAQQAYVDLLLTKIPAGVQQVVDVGCGAGGIARLLVDRGFDLTVVDPDPYMIDQASAKTGGRSRGVVGRYEEVGLPAGGFDLVMMAESCQYIGREKGWAQSARLLRESGHVLIADCFRVRELDQPWLSKAGHKLDVFLNAARRHGFTLVEQVDITPEVAPTMDLYQAEITNKAFPIAEAAMEVFARRFRVGYRVAAYLLRKRVLHLRKKYENQDGGTFAKYKGYYILLFRR